MKRLKKLSALLIASSLTCSIAHAMHQDPHGGREVEDGSKSRTSPPPELLDAPQNLNRLFPSTHRIQTILANRHANAAEPSLFALMQADEKRHFLMRREIGLAATSPDSKELFSHLTDAWTHLMRAAQAQDQFDPEAYAAFRQEPVRKVQEYITALTVQYKANPQKLAQTAALQFPKDVRSNTNPDLPLPLPLFMQFATRLPRSPLLFQDYPALGELNALLNEPVVFAERNLLMYEFIDDDAFSPLMSNHKELIDLDQATSFEYLWAFRMKLECYMNKTRQLCEEIPQQGMKALIKTTAVAPYIERAVNIIKDSGTVEEAQAAVGKYVELILALNHQVQRSTLDFSHATSHMEKMFNLLRQELATIFGLIETWQPGFLTELLQGEGPLLPTREEGSGVYSPQTISSPHPHLDTSRHQESLFTSLSSASSAARSPVDDSLRLKNSLDAIDALPDDDSVYAGTQNAAKMHRRNARAIATIFKTAGVMPKDSRIENTPMTLTGTALKDFLREKFNGAQQIPQLAADLAIAQKRLEETRSKREDAGSTSSASSAKKPPRK